MVIEEMKQEFISKFSTFGSIDAYFCIMREQL